MQVIWHHFEYVTVVSRSNKSGLEKVDLSIQKEELPPKTKNNTDCFILVIKRYCCSVILTKKIRTKE